MIQVARQDALGATPSPDLRDDHATALLHLLDRFRVSETPARFQRLALEFILPKVAADSLAWIPATESEPTVQVGAPVRIPGRESLRRLLLAGDPEPLVIAPGDAQRAGYLAVFVPAGGGRPDERSLDLLGLLASIIAAHRSNARVHMDLKDLMFGVIRALTAAIDAKDDYTSGHSERVARIAVRLAEAIGLGEHEQNDLYLMGLLHDIGKIGIDDRILKKPEKLTNEEYRAIQSHVEIGVKILSDLKSLKHLLPGVEHHHEAYDGSGYPDGLRGEDIPLPARILAVADSFDAMSSSRSYRDKLSPDEIESRFERGLGLQWDPMIVNALRLHWQEIASIQEKGLGESLMRVVSTTVGRRTALRSPRGKTP